MENISVDPVETDKTRGQKRKFDGTRPPFLAYKEIENEPIQNFKFEGVHCLDWYDSDISLKIDAQTMMIGEPLKGWGWSYIWSGARSTYGFATGKVYYEVKILDEIRYSNQEEPTKPISSPLKELRVGWSTNDTEMMLGREPSSYAYSSKGKTWNQGKCQPYGEEYAIGDIIGCYLDIQNDNFSISFTINGNEQGVAYQRPISELFGKALFPHVCTRSFTFEINLGYNINYTQNTEDTKSISQGEQKEPWSNPLPSYAIAGNAKAVGNFSHIEKREECEMLTIIGLPYAGKTTWANENAKAYPEKRINVIGMPQLLERSDIEGQSAIEYFLNQETTNEAIGSFCPPKFGHDERRRCIDDWLALASRRLRNVTIDICPTSYTPEYRWNKQFEGMIRKAVIVVPSHESYMTRIEMVKKSEDAKDARISKSRKWIENNIIDKKLSFSLPANDANGPFNEVLYVELDESAATALIEKYREEGKEEEMARKSRKTENLQQDAKNRTKKQMARQEHFNRMRLAAENRAYRQMEDQRLRILAAQNRAHKQMEAQRMQDLAAQKRALKQMEAQNMRDRGRVSQNGGISHNSQVNEMYLQQQQAQYLAAGERGLNLFLSRNEQMLQQQMFGYQQMLAARNESLATMEKQKQISQVMETQKQIMSTMSELKKSKMDIPSKFDQFATASKYYTDSSLANNPSSNMQLLSGMSMYNDTRGLDMRTAMMNVHSQGMLGNNWQSSGSSGSATNSTMGNALGSAGMNFSDFSK